MEPFQIRSPPIEVEDFTIDFKSLWNFKRDSSAKISGHSIEDSICYVLPSFRKCHITSITHSIPKNTPFKDYNALKQHWKLSYGYRLPGDECQLYFNVRFNGSNVFTYPEWCVRKNDAVRYLRCDTDEICSLFFTDLEQRMPSIFSKPFKFTNQSLFWQKNLPTADKGNKSFLTNHPQFNNTNKTKAFTSNTKAISKKESTTSGFQYEKSEMVSSISTCSNPTQTNSSRLVQATSRNVNSKPLHSTPSIKNLSLNKSADEMKTNQLPPPKTIQNSRSVVTNVTNHKKTLKTQLSTKPSSLKEIHQKQTKAFPKNSPLLGGNIIDIPDSPFDQLVPEELLQSNMSMNNDENTLLYQDQNNVKPSNDFKRNEQNSKSTKDKESNQTNDDCFINKSDFSLIDESMFEDGCDDEGQVVPDQSTGNVSSIKTLQTDQANLETNFTEGVKQQSQRESSQFKPIQSDTDTDTDTSRVVPSSSISNAFADDDIFPKGDTVQVGEKRKDINDGIPSSQKLVPQFGRCKKKKNVFNATKQISSTQPSLTNRSTESTKVVPSFKTKTNLFKATSFSKSTKIIPEKRKLQTTHNVSSTINAKKPKVITKTPSSSTKPSIIKTPTNCVQNRKELNGNIRNSPLPPIPLVTSTDDFSTKKKSFSCVQKEPFTSSQGLSLANEILRNISSSQSTVKGMSESQGSNTIQQTPDSTASFTNNQAAKKPRAKPKINEDINVEEMARTGKLSKVNAPTLKNWLRSKSVVFKASEKKDALVLKALEYLGIPNGNPAVS
ncbi:uncharacterized protein C18orf63-like isoform X2 [Clytia hemisphaerica]